MLQKEEKLTSAIHDMLLNSNIHDVVISYIFDINIKSHIPIGLDESYIEKWTECTIEIDAQGLRYEDGGLIIRNNYHIVPITILLRYTSVNDVFEVAIKDVTHTKFYKKY